LRPREILALAARARSELKQRIFWYERAGPALPADWIESRCVVDPLGVACVASIHRNGYYREAGTHYLAGDPSELGLRFLLLRSDDIVDSTRSIAEAALERRLVAERAGELARALPIVEALRSRRRGGGGRVVRAIDELLLAHPAALRVELGDADPVLRLAAYRLLVRAEPALGVLCSALADGDQRARDWAARRVCSGHVSDADKRELLPLLESRGSAYGRNLALRARAKLEAGDAPLLRALVDSRARVRYTARSLLRARHPERDFAAARLAALEVLARAGASVREVVGALGALADVGTTGDLAQLRPWLEHPSRRVRAEARRTEQALSGTGGRW
jgi:hypothetical protein